MKNQALISSKDKSRKLKCCLPQFLFGSLGVKSETSGQRVRFGLSREIRSEIIYDLKKSEIHS